MANSERMSTMRNNITPNRIYPSRRVSLAVFASFIFLFTMVRSSEAQQKTAGNIDWIFVVDTSKSRRGVGPGAQNVFEEVKEQIRQFIHTANDDDTIAIYTFDEKPTLIKNVLIRSSFDRQDLLDGLQEIRPEGNWTYTGDAVAKALNRAEIIQAKYTDQTREVTILLFTDDQEDHDPAKPSSKFLRDIPISKN